MANIYDFEDPPPRPPRPEEVPPSKGKRERRRLSGSEIARGKRTLMEMVEGAFQTLQDATEHADWPTAIKACQIILDRTGFGPRSTVDVNSTTLDLTELTKEQLAERAFKLSEMIRGRVVGSSALELAPRPNKEPNG